jgi:hypothetical protein
MYKKHFTPTLLCLAFLLLTTIQSFSNPKIDPIRFTIKTDAGHITLNEEFEIRITASYTALNPNLVYVFEGSNSFKLKVVTPEGFQQTGGTFRDFAGVELTKSKPTITYTLKGKFTSPTNDGSFLLLRSHRNATTDSDFILVGQVKFNAFTPLSEESTGQTQTARIASSTQEFIPYMTMAQLRSGLADTAKVVYINEGGRSGMFHYEPTNTTSADDSSMVLRNGSKRYLRHFDGHINIKWFGAKGDGISDDTKAIQKAIDYLNPSSALIYKFEQSPKSGGTVFVPRGRFRITETIWLTNSIRLLGNTGPSPYSNRFNNHETASIIVGDFNYDAFMIQTKSWRITDSALNPVTPGHVAYNESTHWRQSDKSKLTLTSGAALENLVLVNTGSKKWGGVRFCSSTYGSIKNVEISQSNIGLLMDCALFNKIDNIHIDAKVAGIVVSESAISNTISHAYINSFYKSSFDSLGIPVPGYLDLNRYNTLKGELNYNSSKQAVALFVHGADGLQLDDITIEGWDIGLVNKLGRVNASMLYFEHIYDTAILASRSNTVVSMVELVNVKNWYGIDDYVKLTVLSEASFYDPAGGTVFKGYDALNPGANLKIVRSADNITQNELRTSIPVINTSMKADSLKNNNITTAYDVSGVPFYGNLFTYGGSWNSYYQSQILVSASDMPPRLAFRGKGDGGVNGLWSGWREVLSTSGGALTGDLAFAGFNGYHAIRKGNGDGATYSTYNIYMQGRAGMGMMDNNGVVRGVYNYATGAWDVKDGFYINGVRLRAAASSNSASTAAGAAPTKAEFDALLNELRDLKTKMRSANLLAP